MALVSMLVEAPLGSSGFGGGADGVDAGAGGGQVATEAAPKASSCGGAKVRLETPAAQANPAWKAIRACAEGAEVSPPGSRRGEEVRADSAAEAARCGSSQAAAPESGRSRLGEGAAVGGEVAPVRGVASPATGAVVGTDCNPERATPPMPPQPAHDATPASRQGSLRRCT